MSQSSHLSVLIMAKNETKRLGITLESIKKYANSIIFLDTGSTDDTIDIIKEFCKTNSIDLHLRETTFTNFEVTRNEALNFAYEHDDIDFILLLDVNDELKGGDNLIKFINSDHVKESSAYLINQQWYSGTIDSYFNVRLIKTRKNWYYKGVVHEYIEQTHDNDINPKLRIDAYDNDNDTGITIYQDRTKDDDKTGKRFHNDKILLLNEYLKNPQDARTVFYLAQTFSCLNEYEEALKYYEIRSKMGGFEEEVFISLLRVADYYNFLNKDKWTLSMSYYLNAFAHSKRLEPLIAIIDHYKDCHQWDLAYIFTKLALDIEYPVEASLFVDKLIYDYKRYHLMGIIGYYAKKFDDGRNGCLMAINYGHNNSHNVDIDISNLKFYKN